MIQCCRNDDAADYDDGDEGIKLRLKGIELLNRMFQFPIDPIFQEYFD
jgi:hypothetical protein